MKIPPSLGFRLAGFFTGVSLLILSYGLFDFYELYQSIHTPTRCEPYYSEDGGSTVVGEICYYEPLPDAVSLFSDVLLETITLFPDECMRVELAHGRDVKKAQLNCGIP